MRRILEVLDRSYRVAWLRWGGRYWTHISQDSIASKKAAWILGYTVGSIAAGAGLFALFGAAGVALAVVMHLTGWVGGHIWWTSGVRADTREVSTFELFDGVRLRTEQLSALPLKVVDVPDPLYHRELCRVCGRDVLQASPRDGWGATPFAGGAAEIRWGHNDCLELADMDKHLEIRD